MIEQTYETLEHLLYQISVVSHKCDELNWGTGACFNIFTIAGIGSNEVCICRILRELLDPKGRHGIGPLFLGLFFKTVLKLKISPKDLPEAKVKAEYVIAGDRRIDLFIHVGAYKIPIEVKIYAKDQPSQCFDYLAYAKDAKGTKLSKLYYLTRYGNAPSDKSLNKKDDSGVVALPAVEDIRNRIIPISFQEDILTWLGECLQEEETMRIAPVRETVLQLMAVIRGFTNKLEDKRKMEIQQIIASSSENMRAAVDATRVIDECRTDMIIKLFTALEKELTFKLNITPNIRNYTERSVAFYNQKGSSYPGISYHIDGCMDRCFRIEIDHRLYAGFYSCTGGGLHGDVPLANNYCMPNQNTFWCYLPNAIEDDSPNFKEPNDTFFNLFDTERFEEFVLACTESIRQIFGFDCPASQE